MSPRGRALALTAHVGTSVGWLGAVAAFLALAVAGVSRNEPEVVRSMYVAMNVSTWAVIVPLAIAALVTGIVQSIGTPWGLVRHYWIVVKLTLTVLATIVLFIHTQPIGQVAAVAESGPLAPGELWGLRLQLVGDASAALFVLTMVAALSVYKPWGLTQYGIRQIEAERGVIVGSSRRARPAGRYVLVAFAVALALIALLHLFGGGMHLH
jgi:hypothetical protein